MSNSLSKAIFEDNTEMFTVGDCSHVVLERLYASPEEAMAAYRDGEVPVDEAEYIWATAEPVVMMTTYGGGEWEEMLRQNATASRGLLITRPHHPERNNSFGYGS
jgi:hypothetical protein